MSIAGIILVIILIFKFMLNPKGEYQFFLFETSILVSLFINVGYFCKGLFNISYSSFMMYLYIIYSLIKLFLLKRQQQEKRKRIFSILILAIIIILSFFNLLNNTNLAQIVPMDTIVDEVAFGRNYLITPTFYKGNILAFRDLMIFCLFSYLSYEYVYNKNYILNIINAIKRTSNIFFIFLIFEAIVDNFISTDLIRDIINYLFGITDKTYISAAFRYGIYNSYGLFVEPSYVGVIILVYYSIVYLVGFKSNKDICFFVISFVVIFLSGASTGVALVPFGILVIIKRLFKLRKRNMLYVFAIFIVFLICGVIFENVINNNIGFLKMAIEYANIKMFTYINGDISGSGSGYARSFGNKICYEVLKINPIFGVGLGTTRGFGLIPSAVANLGIAGMISYIYFFKCNFNLTINKSNRVLLIINLIYLTSMISIWYLYMPAIIGLFIYLNTSLYRSSEINESYSIMKNHN